MKKFFYIMVCFVLITSCSKQNYASHQQQKEESIPMEETPLYLYKVLSIDDWGKSCKILHLSPMDFDFIHLSTESQLNKIIDKYWAESVAYMVLKLETAKLSGDLILETNPGGTTQYYHLYNGSIPLTAIIEARVHKKDSASFVEKGKSLLEWNRNKLTSHSTLTETDIAILFAPKFVVIANGRSYDANYQNYLEFLNQFRADIQSIDYQVQEYLNIDSTVIMPLNATVTRLDGKKDSFSAIMLIKFNKDGKIVHWQEVYCHTNGS